jgi:hypothetical protein
LHAVVAGYNAGGDDMFGASFLYYNTACFLDDSLATLDVPDEQGIGG